MTRQRVLVTGANGFVGRALCAEAVLRGWMVNGVTRQSCYFPCESGIKNYLVNSIDEETNWQLGLIEVNVVVHLAARVHVMQDKAGDPLAQFRRINVEGTLNLARQAAVAGVIGNP